MNQSALLAGILLMSTFTASAAADSRRDGCVPANASPVRASLRTNASFRARQDSVPACFRQIDRAMPHCAGASIVVSALLGLAPAEAADPFGTAGSFRQAGWAQCGVPITELMKGACDPAPVDPALEPHERVRAHIARARALVSFARMEEAQ